MVQDCPGRTGSPSRLHISPREAQLRMILAVQTAVGGHPIGNVHITDTLRDPAMAEPASKLSPQC
jgi:hypothetical protein